MSKFWIWLYSLFEPLWLNFLALTFPSVNPAMLVEMNSRATQPQLRVRKGDLNRIYTNHKNPKSSYRIFYLRVTYYGWDIQHALQTPDRKQEFSLDGNHYSLRELYNNCPKRRVTYAEFKQRVIRHGWSPIKALNTPPSVR